MTQRHARVLLAEDDETLRRLLADVLRQDGYEVEEARDGTELLERIDASLVVRWERAEQVVVVADVHMPGFTGLDVLAILRCAHCVAPVVLITAYGDPETHAEARELGAVVLDKPFELDALRSALADAVPLG